MSEEKIVEEIVEKELTQVQPDTMAMPPKTVYEITMARMTPEIMANMGVKLISVNSSELFWVTSTGQLYGFAERRKAIEAEYNWLMSEPK